MTLTAGNEDELIAALNTVNQGSGAYVLTLTGDFIVKKELPALEKSTLTIVPGKDQVIISLSGTGEDIASDTTDIRNGTSKESDFDVQGGATLNLGNPDGGNRRLVLQGENQKYSDINNSALISVWNGTVNMYDGVTITGQTNNSATHGSGVQLNAGKVDGQPPDRCVFNMYGGAITNNTSSTSAGFGGGVIVLSSSAMALAEFNMYDGEISDNIGQSSSNDNSYGGGVFVYHGRFVMNGGKIKGNAADQGGGVCAIASDVQLKGGEISDNTARAGEGGGLYFTGNPKSKINGVITFNPNVEPLEDETIEIGMRRSAHNGADASGTAPVVTPQLVSKQSGNTEIVISGNTAKPGLTWGKGRGGGVYVATLDTEDQTKVALDNLTVKKNTAQSGGGIYFASYDGMTLNHSEVSENHAVNGCGIAVEYVDRISFSDTQIAKNSALKSTPDKSISYGGGIYAKQCKGLTLTNTTITGNNSVDFGAGLAVDVRSDITLHINENVQITENEAQRWGGGLFSKSTVNITGMPIIANNTAVERGADIATKDAGSISGLPEAASMGQTYLADGKNHAIDGWYSDAADARYKPSVTGTPLTLNGTVPANTYLVASYRIVDDTAPVLSENGKERIKKSEATVQFTSDEVGTYYYAVVDHGAEAPRVDTSGAGTVCDTNMQTLTIPKRTLGSDTAKDVYVVVKDAAGNTSAPLKIELPPFTPSFSVTPDSLYFEMAAGGPSPAEKEVVVTNDGNQPLTITVNLPNNFIVRGDALTDSDTNKSVL